MYTCRDISLIRTKVKLRIFIRIYNWCIYATPQFYLKIVVLNKRLRTSSVPLSLLCFWEFPIFSQTFRQHLTVAVEMLRIPPSASHTSLPPCWDRSAVWVALRSASGDIGFEAWKMLVYIGLYSWIARFSMVFPFCSHVFYKFSSSND